MPTLLDQSDSEPEIQCIIDSVDCTMHNGSVTLYIEKGRQPEISEYRPLVVAQASQ
jgi:hypothetical protein